MNRYFIEISYLGKAYSGWQIQENANTIQAEIERALHTILRKPISVLGAGRTDAGVHALSFVAHFDWDGNLDLPPENNLLYTLNQVLPLDISVNSLRKVHNDAHARFSALWRTYQYNISNRKNPFTTDTAWLIRYPLDIELMQQASQMLLEVSDFASFCKLGSDIKTTHCTVVRAHWESTAEGLTFTIRANRFLRDMVRAVVGTLVDVGRGKISLQEFAQIIEQKDRRAAGISVPACGLMLMEIEYPPEIYRL